MLDTQTALIFMVSVSAVNGLTSLILWKTQKNLPGLHLIAAGNLLIDVSLWFIDMSNAHVITLRNVLTILSQYLIVDGIAVFFGRPSRPKVLVAVVIASALFWEGIQAWDPNQIGLRVLVATIITLAVMARAGLAAYGSSTPRGLARTFIIACLGVHAVVLVVRCAVSLIHHDQAYVLSPPVAGWFFLEITLIQTLLFFGILLLVGARLNERLQHQNATLAAERQVHDELRQFLHVLGHELHTPLAVIDSAAEMMQFLLPNQPEGVSKRLATIRGTVGRVDTLVTNLLTAERAALVASREELIDMTALTHEVMDFLAETHGAHRLEFHREDEGEILVRGDREMLFTAILNIVSNALKYSPTDSTVSVSQTLRDGRAVLSVRDRGIGFPPEQLARAGERFFRADNARTQSGTGLGLHIVKTVLERHAGSLDLRNAPDGGTVAELRLPVATTG